MRGRHGADEAGTTLVEVVVASVIFATLVASLGTAGALLRAADAGERTRASDTMQVASLAHGLSRSLGSIVDVMEATSDRLVIERGDGGVEVRIEGDGIVIDVDAAGSTRSAYLVGILSSATLSFRDGEGRALGTDDAGRLGAEDLDRIALLVLDVGLAADGAHGHDGTSASTHRLVTLLGPGRIVP
jgi:hypothetical protein